MSDPITRTVNRIRSIEERAKEAGIDTHTLRRMIWRSEGPATIQLSPRRIGISDRDWEAWLDSRRNGNVVVKDPERPPPDPGKQMGSRHAAK
jgi:hypothetical protein